MKTVLIIIASLAGFVLFWFLIASLAGSPEESEKKSENTSIGYDELEARQQMKDSLEVVRKTTDSLNRELRLKASTDLKTFRKNTDEFSGDSFYRHSQAPKYTNQNFIFPYIGEVKGQYFLRLKFQYEADDWLFIKQVKIKTDKQDYELSGSFERDNQGGRIWEWADMQPSQAEINMLHDMATSDKVLIRYVGNQYQKDRELTKKEKVVIGSTLDIYENMNIGL